MAVGALITAGVYVNELDASPFVNEIGSPFSVDVVYATTLSEGGFVKNVPTLRHGEITVSGFQDFASGGFYEKVNQSDLSALGQIIVVPGGTAASAGDPAAWIVGFIDALTQHDGAVGQLAALSVHMVEGSSSSSLNGTMAFGPCLHPLATRTTGANGTAVALAGPSATQHMFSALCVPTGSGGNLVVKIQSDDGSGFSSATDRITFTTATGPTFEAKMTAGSSGWASETHHRVTYTISAGSFAFVVVCGVITTQF